MSISSNNVLVAMNLPTQVSQFIIKAKAVYDSMTKASSYFGSSSALLSELNSEIIKLENAQKGLEVKPPTSTVAIRDASLSKSKVILRNLSADVQAVADKNPENATAIIQSSGFDVRKTKTNTARKDTVVDGTESGTVLLSAATAGAHQWQQSFDGGNTIIALNPTTNASTTVYNLVPGQKVWFQNRTVLPYSTYGEWSSWISIVPK